MKAKYCIPLLIALLAFVVPLMGQVDLVPNTIQGTIRFSNSNPAILSLLEAPENEGISNLYV